MTGMETVLIFVNVFLMLIFIMDRVFTDKSKNNDNDNKKENKISTEKVKILLDEKSVEKVDEYINALIKSSADTYMILNVNFNPESYLNSEKVEELSNYIFATIKKNLTDASKEVIGLVYNIDTEEKINELLQLKIKIYVLAITVSNNKPL